MVGNLTANKTRQQYTPAPSSEKTVSDIEVMSKLYRRLEQLYLTLFDALAIGSTDSCKFIRSYSAAYSAAAGHRARQSRDIVCSLMPRPLMWLPKMQGDDHPTPLHVDDQERRCRAGGIGACQRCRRNFRAAVSRALMDVNGTGF